MKSGLVLSLCVRYKIGQQEKIRQAESSVKSILVLSLCMSLCRLIQINGCMLDKVLLQNAFQEAIVAINNGSDTHKFTTQLIN